MHFFVVSVEDLAPVRNSGVSARRELIVLPHLKYKRSHDNVTRLTAVFSEGDNGLNVYRRASWRARTSNYYRTITS